MQIDMHYYGVYCLARTAGLNQETAHTIAYASQFTDDSVQNEVEHNQEHGAAVVAEETAHHATDVENLSPANQRWVWVPFHFLPGNAGGSYRERLICRKDSAVAHEMLNHYLDNADLPFASQLMGVAAHVYADTFAHYGFSGVASELNLVERTSLEYTIAKKTIQAHVDKKKENFWDRFAAGLDQAITGISGQVAEDLTGGLGHAAVATLPDRPFINWKLKYEAKRFLVRPSENRCNPETFLEGCEKLHALFCRFAKRRPDLARPKTRLDFGELSGELGKIIRFEGKKEQRIAKWQGFWGTVPQMVTEAGMESAIPQYDPGLWHGQRDSFEKLDKPKEMLRLKVYGFYQAASFHKHYVLRQLLPENGLIVV
jgi:hypothetical protein